MAGLTSGLATDAPASSRRAGCFVAAVALGGALGPLLLVAMIAGLGGPSASSSGESATPGGGGGSLLARRDIPPALRLLYEQAARRYSLDWALLAAIGKVECDHGRDPDPSCRIVGSVNGAGAGGPMQFIASTWARYGVDGDGDGIVNRWDAPDAIYSAANYLRDSGAPGDLARAILAYNHSGAYLAEVEHWAARYRPSTAGEGAGDSSATDGVEDPETPTPVTVAAGAQARLSPINGHVALIPAAAPPVVQALVVAGNEVQDLPYGPDGHPDPRGAADEDCSSSVNYLFYRAGLRPIAEIVKQNPLAQDYMRWGDPGPGRWVTVFATLRPTPHVFVVIAGLRLDTSHRGTDVGPNRYQDGPRWRLLDHIPSWARWSVRHPPGL